MRFSLPLQVLERGPGGEVSESPELNTKNRRERHIGRFLMNDRINF